jgi:hypothetical protein
VAERVGNLSHSSSSPSNTTEDATANPAIYAQLSAVTDTSSLILFLPALETFAWEQSIEETVEIYAATLRKMGDLNALALLPETLRFLQLIMEERFGPNNELWSAESLNAVYLPIFKSIGSFSRQNVFGERQKRRQIESTIQIHAFTLVRNLDNQLSRLPGPSNPQIPRSQRAVISNVILELLFGQHYLSPEMMSWLLRYTKIHRIEQGSWTWWRCTMVAIESGEEKLGKKYDLVARKEAKREAKARAENEAGRGPITAFGSAASRKFPAGEHWPEYLRKAIGGIVRTRLTPDFGDVMSVLEKRLQKPPDGTTPHVWSHLINAARHDKTITAAMLRDLHGMIAESAVNGHTLTPIMMGYMEKGDPVRAWQTWLDLVHRQQIAPYPRFKGKYVDRVALAVGTYVCHALHGLEAAVTLVDAWARRVDSPSTPENYSNSISLDTRNLNILLHLCTIDRRPSIAFRLFAAAQSRWGVYSDGISLALLLDSARFTTHDNVDKMPDVKTRLRQMADELRSRHTGRKHMNNNEAKGAYDAYDAYGFSKGPVSVLLDRTGYKWDDENDEPPWLRAKSKVESVLFANWPWLSTIPSPLDYTRGPYAHKLRDFSSFFLTRQDMSDSAENPPSMRLPDPSNAQHTHLVPSASTFQSYISLLGYYHLTQEIPRALAWMKDLDIKPKKQTMFTALMYIESVEGPRRLFSDWDDGASRLLGDGDVLRRWLKDWLGRGVPDEAEVAEYVREYMRRHHRLTA